ncbi:MAG: O-antigen ligase family protein [Bacteroidota bacterium]
MRSKLAEILRTAEATQIAFYLFGGSMLLSIFFAVALDFYSLALFPAFFLLVFVTIVDYKAVFYLLLFCIPISTEIVLPNGFGTDLPTEPLMIGLTAVYLIAVLHKGTKLDTSILTNPITLLLLLHIGWTLVSAITSAQVVVSIKFLLAKLWYTITFYFLAAQLLRDRQEIRRFFWLVFIPLLVTIISAIVRHKSYDFSFEFVHKILHPFYRNHVAYAAIIVVFAPYLWLIWRWTKHRSLLWWGFIGIMALFLVAIQLSYTRAAYAGVVVAIGAYFVIRWRLTKVVLALSMAGAIALVAYLTTNNKYLDFAPDYERTITHTSFDNLLEATYQMQDISTMERVYRWVAAGFMIGERPIFGFGPGNFFFFYKSYTVTSFKTYVSDNPEGSGIHSYYIMLMVEQGIPGLLFFLLLVFYTLIRGEYIYHQLSHPRDRQLLMAALLSLIVLMTLQLINDLVETDKIGPFFFIALAIIVNLDLRRGIGLREGGGRGTEG